MCLSHKAAQTEVMLCGWESNHRSGVALAIHHSLRGILTYGLNGLRQGDEYPAYGPVWTTTPFSYVSKLHMP